MTTKKVKLYLDNCCYNRMFDNQNNVLIRIETLSINAIKSLIKSGKYQLTWSYILDFENSKNPKIMNRENTNTWKLLSNKYIVEENDIIDSAKKLMLFGLQLYDSFHIACAIYDKCDYFITVDKGILKQRNKIKEIRICNPIDFIKEVENA